MPRLLHHISARYLQMLQIETFRRDASRYTEGVDRVSNLTHTSKV